MNKQSDQTDRQTLRRTVTHKQTDILHFPTHQQTVTGTEILIHFKLLQFLVTLHTYTTIYTLGDTSGHTNNG